MAEFYVEIVKRLSDCPPAVIYSSLFLGPPLLGIALGYISDLVGRVIVSKKERRTRNNPLEKNILNS
jgi:hypothetical protein